MPSVHLAEQIIGQLLIGQHNGVVSPVKTDSPTLFIDIHCPVDSCGAVSFEYAQVALFLVDCHCEVNYQPLQVNDLIVVADPQNVHLKLSDNSRLVVIGGEPLPEPRFMWWNFVSTNKERIRKAAKDWENQCMWQVPNENDFIPLPKDPLPESLTALLKGAIFLID